jgi:hypothetical protein
MTTLLVIEGINPMPWRAPSAATRRFGGKVVPYTFPNPEVVLYQEAVREYVMAEYPSLEMIEPGQHGLYVSFWFWRSLNYGGQRRNAADTTNMVKALEDALQGLVYGNDKHNRTVTGNVVAQARDIEPLIMITAIAYESDPFIGTEQIARSAMGAAQE